MPHFTLIPLDNYKNRNPSTRVADGFLLCIETVCIVRGQFLDKSRSNSFPEKYGTHDLSNPLMYHGCIDSIRSVKDCPTASRLRLLPLPHYIFQSNIYTTGICHYLKSNIFVFFHILEYLFITLCFFIPTNSYHYKSNYDCYCSYC